MARQKVSVTVDPVLLHQVDSYVSQHPELDRSKVIEQALKLWTSALQDLAMEAQFASPDAPADEWDSWRLTRRAAASRLGR